VEAGVSVRGRVFASEDDVSIHQMQGRIRQWPNREPSRARGKPQTGRQIP
jgi:uncharacterized protein